MPVKLLVKANNAPVGDASGKWLDMETVAVVDVDRPLSVKEGTPQNGGGFYHVIVTDRTKDDADIQQYLDPVWDNDDPETRMILKRRNLHLDPNNPVIAPVSGTGEVEVDYATLQSATEAEV